MSFVRQADCSLPPAPAGRDERVDFWRGLCVVGMVAWHLLTDPAFPGWFSFPVIQAFNFVAEGFVLVAGLSVGMRAARHAADPIPVGYYLRRAGILLALHYALVVSVIVIERCVASGAQSSPSQPLATQIVGTIWLRYQPYLADILSVFVFLFAATPWLLAIGRRFGATALLLLSLGIYAASLLVAEIAPGTAALWELNHYGAFDFNTWQLVFVAGIVLGLHYEEALGRAKRSFRLLACAALAAFALAFAYRLAVTLGESTWCRGLPECCRDGRHPLTPPRLAYVGLEMLILGLITVRFWERLASWWPVRAIVLFGRRSLPVFAASVVLDYLWKAAIGRWSWSFPWNLATLGLDLVLLYLLARCWPRRR